MKKEQLIKKGLLVGIGMAAYAKEKTEKLAKEMIEKGGFSEEEGKRLVRKIYAEADNSRKRITKVLEKELRGLVNAAKNKK